ncbi:hypothetical protein Sjap_023344 [Stephania japonica]|uniref:O-fucosyltransferase family protein n=1 Tax=Stephania japonica TaxID=461633 RepID=A0AAP0EG35_9MAGN
MMARPKTFNKNSSSSIPQTPSNFLHLFTMISHSNNNKNSPPTSSRTHHHHHHNHQMKLCSSPNFHLFFLSLLTVLAFFGISKIISLTVDVDSHNPSIINCSPLFHSRQMLSAAMAMTPTNDNINGAAPTLSHSVMVPLPAHGLDWNISEEEREFWRQPDGDGYRPCLVFSIGYRRASAKIAKEKRRFLVVVASGGLNQQRNQIADAVVIARILEASLVVPSLQVNLIWGDESEFSDLFDVEFFKKALRADVRVVSSLPSSHLVPKQPVETQIPIGVSPQWIRARFLQQLNRGRVLKLKGLDSKLSKNLPSDLQKLRCKVAFHALRFATPIRELGNRLARRIWIEGPYIALHMRLEKDVWVRTGCQTGLGQEFDEIIARERESRPEFLTGRTNMSYVQRRLEGLCPLNAQEVARLLKALGAPRNARIYYAGGEPFGGTEALEPLKREFPNVITKEALAKGGELNPYANRPSALAAIDYIVSLSSDVFMPSHGGNMGRVMQGQRTYSGHRKFIMPNKRAMLPFFENKSLPEEEFAKIMKQLHKTSMKPPQFRKYNRVHDVIAYPVPEFDVDVDKFLLMNEYMLLIDKHSSVKGEQRIRAADLLLDELL